MDYSVIDSSSLPHYLFYPRKDFSEPPEGAQDLMVTVEENTEVHCRLYTGDNHRNPWLLYFHGNGEVASDYDFIAPYYTNKGLNLAVADYRGYGKSSGSPSFRAVIEDAQQILRSFKDFLEQNYKSSDSLWVMGRSLGSISALELAHSCPEDLNGVIIESGFISVVKLIRHLGLPSPGNLSPLEEAAQQKAAAIKLPALIMHGERDHIVPVEQGEELYRTLGSEQKKLFTIPMAGHNDIFFVETENYLREIKTFTDKHSR